MTAIAAELDPVDVCPACPGIPVAAVPVGDPEPVPGGVVWPYQCPDCGTAWTAVFDEFGWVIERSIAPVAEALNGAAREGRAA